MARIFGTTLVLTFVMGLGLAVVRHREDMSTLTWDVGLYHGLLIDLRDRSTGLYLVTLRTEAGISSRRLVLE